MNVAVVGATGLVGRTILRVLEERNFPVDRLGLFASAASEGKKLHFNGKEHTVKTLKENFYIGYDIALFSAGAEVAGKFAPLAAGGGVTVIDNSSRFRRDVFPLMVPEINGGEYRGERIVANPNCSTIQAVLPLAALLNFGLTRVSYVTFQSVSGSGQKGISALKRTLNDIYPYDITKTCIPAIGDFDTYGNSGEENKMIFETRRILGLKNLKISATCVRVPVERCHGVSVAAEFEKPITAVKARELVAKFPGVVLCDDPRKDVYPNSVVAAGRNEVYVGRIREDGSVKNGILFYCVADNIRKGAATNAVQIAETVISSPFFNPAGRC